jgi:RHS repeat-associated protein
VTSYAYDAANAVTQVVPPTGAPTTLGYDANGNLAVENAGGVLTTYSWDAENRLAAVAQPTGGATTCVYDAKGARRGIFTAAAISLLVPDGQVVLMETDASGTTTGEYTNSSDMWGGPTSKRCGRESSFYGFDMSSNSRLLTDGSAEEVAAYLYDAFGVRLDGGGEAGYIGSPIQVLGMDPGFGGLAAPSAPVANPFLFGGQYGYYALGPDRYAAGARVYGAGRGQWDSRDPMGFRGRDWNLRRYVANEPVTGIDPSGMSLDPSPGSCDIRFSIALFIPRATFTFLTWQGVFWTVRGDGRGYNSSTDSNRVRLDVSLNWATGRHKVVPSANESIGTDFLGNTYSCQNVSYITQNKWLFDGSGWSIDLGLIGWDCLYDVLGYHAVPGASIDVSLYLTKNVIAGDIDYKLFPADEIWMYAPHSEPRRLFGYIPPKWIQDSFGPGTLALGQTTHSSFYTGY